jgi:hypothetical protein
MHRCAFSAHPAVRSEQPGAFHPGVKSVRVLANETNVVHGRSYRGDAESRKAVRALCVQFGFFRRVASGAAFLNPSGKEDRDFVKRNHWHTKTDLTDQVRRR